MHLPVNCRTISLKWPHPERIQVACSIEGTTPMCKFRQYGALPVHRIGGRATRNECYLV